MTPDPVWTTSPAKSVPGTGDLGRRSPVPNRITKGLACRMAQSVRLTVAACTRTRIFVGSRCRRRDLRHGQDARTPVGRPGHCLHPANMSSATPPSDPLPQTSGSKSPESLRLQSPPLVGDGAQLFRTAARELVGSASGYQDGQVLGDARLGFEFGTSVGHGLLDDLPVMPGESLRERVDDPRDVLAGVQLVISDQYSGLVKALRRSFQGCCASTVPGPLRPQPPRPCPQDPRRHGCCGVPHDLRPARPRSRQPAPGTRSATSSPPRSPRSAP